MACLLLLAAAGCSSKPADEQPAPVAHGGEATDPLLNPPGPADPLLNPSEPPDPLLNPSSGGSPSASRPAMSPEPAKPMAKLPEPLPQDIGTAWTQAGAKVEWFVRRIRRVGYSFSRTVLAVPTRNGSRLRISGNDPIDKVLYGLPAPNRALRCIVRIAIIGRRAQEGGSVHAACGAQSESDCA